MSVPRLGAGVEDADAPEERGRTAVADRRHLAGLGLAAVEGALQPPGAWPADGLHRTPEVGRRGLVGRVADLPLQSAVADLDESLSRELEVVPLHVDGPRVVA